MRFMVIVEKDFCVVAETACMPELVDLENVVDVRCVVAQKLGRHVTARALFDVFAILLAYPAHTSDIFIENGGKLGTTEARSVDIFASLTGDRQHLIDGQIGMLAAVALVPCQPLQLNCS